MANDTQLLAKSIQPVGNQRFQNDEILENMFYNLLDDKNLTRREIEILSMIIAGHTNKEISQKISRTERTIEYNRNRLMHKLGTKSAAELVKRAISMGITVS